MQQHRNIRGDCYAHGDTCGSVSTLTQSHQQAVQGAVHTVQSHTLPPPKGALTVQGHNAHGAGHTKKQLIKPAAPNSSIHAQNHPHALTDAPINRPTQYNRQAPGAEQQTRGLADSCKAHTRSLRGSQTREPLVGSMACTPVGVPRYLLHNTALDTTQCSLCEVAELGSHQTRRSQKKADARHSCGCHACHHPTLGALIPHKLGGVSRATHQCRQGKTPFVSTPVTKSRPAWDTQQVSNHIKIPPSLCVLKG